MKLTDILLASNVLLLVVLFFILGSHRQDFLLKIAGERIIEKLYELELNIEPDDLEDDMPVYSDENVAKIKTIHDCSHIICNQFKLFDK